jgi:hypothetical protein
MFKKLNFKTLAILFGVLLVLVVLMQVFKNRGSERNFNSQFISVDSAKITSFVIKARGAKDEIKISKSGSYWTFTNNGKTLKAEKGIMEGMVAEIMNIKAERIAATDKEQWAALEVTDSASTRVKVYEGEKLTADFLVGKFSYQQNPQKFTTYVRPYGEDFVYAVSGFLAMTFNKDVNDLRDKTLVNVNSSDITKISFSYPADSSFILALDKNAWTINGEKADSGKVVEYLNTISHLTSYNFVGESVSQANQAFAVNIEGKNFQPVNIKAFATPDTTVRHIVTSNMNPDARFDGSKSDLLKQVFASAKKFKFEGKK